LRWVFVELLVSEDSETVWWHHEHLALE